MMFRLKDIREMANRLGLWEKVMDGFHYFFLPKGLVDDLEENYGEDERDDLFCYEKDETEIYCYNVLKIREEDGEFKVLYDDSSKYENMKDLEKACRYTLTQAMVFREAVNKLKVKMNIDNIKESGTEYEV